MSFRLEVLVDRVSLTNPVKVRDKGGDIGQRSAVGAIERLDANSGGNELALGRELRVQLSAQLFKQEEVVGRILARVGVAWCSSTSRVFPVKSSERNGVSSLAVVVIRDVNRG